jgi:GntR family transcriptional regulator / MocR family aminotransferase
VLGMVLDRDSPRPLGRQLCDALRCRMVSGALAAGSRLPSTRELAAQLGLSRTLVLDAFEQLAAEGYLAGRRGSGSYVRAGVAIAPRPPAASGPRPVIVAPDRDLVDFRTGLPALDLFPRENWARALREAARRLPRQSYGYGDPEGLPALREATAAYLYRARGVRASAGDLVIASGSTQTLALLTRIRCCAERGAVLENPCHRAASALLRREGVPVVPVEVDAQGLDTARLPRARTALAYVTPSHQFPLGTVLSALRRAELIAWARSRGALILEDDYDGEYRYGGPPLLPLRESDPGRVAYAGTFSKVFSPAIRLGYAILPASVREDWRFLKMHSDVHSSLVEQAAMAAFVASGRLERHIHRMRRAYAVRRAVLLEELQSTFGSRCQIGGEASGLHVAVRFPGRSFDAGTVEKIRSAGARVYPATEHALRPVDGLEEVVLLGYGALDERALRRGVQAMASGLGMRPARISAIAPPRDRRRSR